MDSAAHNTYLLLPLAIRLVFDILLGKVGRQKSAEGGKIGWGVTLSYRSAGRGWRVVCDVKQERVCKKKCNERSVGQCSNYRNWAGCLESVNVVQLREHL